MPRTIQNEKPTEIFLAHRFFAVVKCFLNPFTTASEVNSYQEHLKNHKPQEMICMHVIFCSASNFNFNFIIPLFI